MVPRKGVCPDGKQSDRPVRGDGDDEAVLVCARDSKGCGNVRLENTQSRPKHKAEGYEGK
jgi:hypothetical protein